VVELPDVPEPPLDEPELLDPAVVEALPPELLPPEDEPPPLPGVTSPWLQAAITRAGVASKARTAAVFMGFLLGAFRDGDT
jgi:hypothetical protein